jgi:hypothetical protein
VLPEGADRGRSTLLVFPRAPASSTLCTSPLIVGPGFEGHSGHLRQQSALCGKTTVDDGFALAQKRYFKGFIPETSVRLIFPPIFPAVRWLPASEALRLYIISGNDNEHRYFGNQQRHRVGAV